MTMLARFDVAPVQPNRRFARRRLMLQRPGMVADRPGVDVLIHDLSLGGMLIETSAELAVGATLEVELPEAGWTQAEVVWAQGRYYGCRFEQAIPQRTLIAARLMSPTPSEPVEATAPRLATPANDTDLLPLPVRMRVIGALALVAWALVLTPLAAASSLVG